MKRKTKYPGYLKIHKEYTMRYLSLEYFELNALHESVSNSGRGFSTGELRDVGKLLDTIESLGTQDEKGNWKFEGDNFVLEINDRQLQLVKEVFKEMRWTGKFARQILKLVEKINSPLIADPRVNDEPAAIEAAPALERA